MPDTVTIEERPKSRRWTKSGNPRAELVYLVRGTADENEVVSLSENTSPRYYQGIKRQETVLDPIFIDSLHPETCIWEVTFNYYRDSYNSSGTSEDHPPRRHLDTTGGRAHITEAIKTERSEGAPDVGNAIGVTSEGRVEGVDIIVPNFQWSEDHWFPKTKLSDRFLVRLYQLTSKINLKHWRIYKPGCCLFMGATGSWTDDDDGAFLTFKFVGSPDTEKKGVKKGGWDYYWERHDVTETGETGSKTLGAEFKGAYASTVYKSADFIDLGIGR